MIHTTIRDMEDRKRDEGYKITYSTKNLEKIFKTMSKYRLNKVFNLLLNRYFLYADENCRELSVYILGNLIKQFSNEDIDKILEFLLEIVSSKNIHIPKARLGISMLDTLPDELLYKIHGYLFYNIKENGYVKSQAISALGKITYKVLSESGSKVTIIKILETLFFSVMYGKDNAIKQIVKTVDGPYLEEILDFLMNKAEEVEYEYRKVKDWDQNNEEENHIEVERIFITDKNSTNRSIALSLIIDMVDKIPIDKATKVLDWLIENANNADRMFSYKFISTISDFIKVASETQMVKIIALLQTNIANLYYSEEVKVIDKLITHLPKDKLKMILLDLFKVMKVHSHPLDVYENVYVKRTIYLLINELSLEEKAELYFQEVNTDLLNQYILHKITDSSSDCREGSNDILLYMINNIPEQYIEELIKLIVDKVIYAGRFFQSPSYSFDHKTGFVQLIPPDKAIYNNQQLKLISVLLDQKPEIIMQLLLEKLNDNMYKKQAIRALGDLSQSIPEARKEEVLKLLIDKFNAPERPECVESIIKLADHLNENSLNMVIDFFCEKATVKRKGESTNNIAIRALGELENKISDTKLNQIINLLLDKVVNKKTTAIAIEALGKFASRIPESMLPKIKRLFSKKDTDAGSLSSKKDIGSGSLSSKKHIDTEISRSINRLTDETKKKFRDRIPDLFNTNEDSNLNQIDKKNNSGVLSIISEKMRDPLLHYDKNKDFSINEYVQNMEQINEEERSEQIKIFINKAKNISDSDVIQILNKISLIIPKNNITAVLDLLLNKYYNRYEYTNTTPSIYLKNIIQNQFFNLAIESNLRSKNKFVKKYTEGIAVEINYKAFNTGRNEDLLVQKTNLLNLERTIEEMAIQDLDFTKILQEKYGIKANNIESDGNCFFRAVEDQLKLLNNRKEVMNYQQIREFALNYINNHRGQFQDFIIDETIEQYLDRMSQDGQWADHNFVQALSRELQINIVIISSNHVDMPQVIGSIEYQQTIYLGHIVELHYVSLERISDNETDNQKFLALKYKVEQELLSLNTGSNEQKENSVDNYNNLTVLNVENLYENQILNHPTLLKQIYDLADITTVNLFIELGKNKDVAEQISEAINQFGTEHVLEILFGDKLKALGSKLNSNLILKQKSDTTHDINQNLLSTSMILPTEPIKVSMDAMSIEATVDKSNNDRHSWVARYSNEESMRSNCI